MDHYFTNSSHLPSEIRTLNYKYKDISLSFFSDNGVFSKSEIDVGSAALVETVLSNINQKHLNILDVGCGYGFIGVTLSKLLDSHVDMIDVNLRAIHLANMNVKNNKVDSCAFESNVYQNITNKYDLIVTNPPIRAGKEVVLKILLEAKDHLLDSGGLWFVIRKNQGAKSVVKQLENFYDVSLLKRHKGFYCFLATLK